MRSSLHDHFGHSLLWLLDDPVRPYRRYAFSEGGFSEREEPGLGFDTRDAYQR